METTYNQPTETTKNFDPTKYIGKKTTIENYKITPNGQYGKPYITFYTKTLETIQTTKGNIEIKGTKILGIIQKQDGTYTSAKGSKLDQFLTKFGATNLEEIKGKECILIPEERNGKTYLRIL